ncbi:hypothetical protein [Streptomyces sp. NPDC058613]|uniref:hypothetical protein n=1 Tax=unclassified Streptomyces TaxID=2593676 RepID=UPI00364DBA54
MDTPGMKQTCEHPSFKKEYYLGSDTGDKECTACGETFGPQEMKELRERKASGN